MGWKASIRIMVAGLAGFAGIAHGQGLAEFGAVAGGAVAGGAAGKAVGEALANTLGNLDKQTAQAASTGDPSLEVGPAVPTTLETVKTKAKLGDRMGTGKDHALLASSTLNPGTLNPGDLLGASPQWPAPPEFLSAIPTLEAVLPNPAPLPPPEMTRESFKTITAGMNRTDLLRLGTPAFKVTMDEDGHLVEIYSYHQGGARIGSVRLNDGAVASAKP